MSDPMETYYAPLQSALRAVGVRGFDARVDDTDSDLIFSITSVNGSEAFNIAALLRAGLDSSAEPLPCTWPAYEVMTRYETESAHRDLAYALAEADIKGLTLEQDAHRGLPVLHIRNLVGGDAAELAELLHAGLADHYATATALRDAVYAHGVNGDEVVPAPGVRSLLVRLGEISIPTALGFGTALGAVPHLRRVEELADHAEGEQIMDRLDEAVESASGGFMDMFFHPCCEKCSHVASIALGPITLPVAKALTAVLQPGQPS